MKIKYKLPWTNYYFDNNGSTTKHLLLDVVIEETLDGGKVVVRDEKGNGYEVYGSRLINLN